MAIGRGVGAGGIGVEVGGGPEVIEAQGRAGPLVGVARLAGVAGGLGALAQPGVDQVLPTEQLPGFADDAADQGAGEGGASRRVAQGRGIQTRGAAQEAAAEQRPFELDLDRDAVVGHVAAPASRLPR